MFSNQVKEILRKDRAGISITTEEIDKVLEEVRAFKKANPASKNPDFFTAVFIEIGMLKKKNGGIKYKSATVKACA